MEFTTKDEERLAIDDELGGFAAFFKMRRGLLRGEIGDGQAGGKQENWQRGKVDSHDGRESTTTEFCSNSAIWFHCEEP